MTVTALPMRRERLPTRRESETIKFDHNGVRYFATVGFYPDGRPAELFLDCSRSGDLLQGTMRDAAIAVSLALQHGVTLATLREAMLREADGSPAGVMSRALDLIAEAVR